MTKNIDRIVLGVLTATKIEQGLSREAAAAWASEHLEAGVARAQAGLANLAPNTGAHDVGVDLRAWAETAS